MRLILLLCALLFPIYDAYSSEVAASIETEREAIVAARFDRLDFNRKYCRVYGEVLEYSQRVRVFLGQFWVQSGRIVVATQGELAARLAPRGARIEEGSPLATIKEKLAGWSTFSDGGRWKTDYPGDTLVAELRSNEKNASFAGSAGRRYETIRAKFEFEGPLCTSLMSKPGNFASVPPFPEKTLIDQAGLMYLAHLSGKPQSRLKEWQKEVLQAVNYVERLR